MKNIIIKISPPIFNVFHQEIALINKLSKKNNISLIGCNGEKKICIANETMSKIKFFICKSKLSNGLKF